MGISTFKPIPFSLWIKNNTQQKPLRQKVYRTDRFPFIEKENLTDKVSLSGTPDIDPEYTINQVFNLHDPLDNILLSKIENESIFLTITEKITLGLLQKYQNLDPVIAQL